MSLVDLWVLYAHADAGFVALAEDVVQVMEREMMNAIGKR